MRLMLHTILLAMLTACASYKSDVYTQHHTNGEVVLAADSELFVKLDFSKPVIIRGLAADDETANTTQMMYSGDAGVVGFLAQIAAHSAVSSGMEDDRLSERQQEANKILEPLHEVFSGFTQQSLDHSNDRYKFANSEKIIAGITLESYPVFYVSHDLKCIALKHLVKIYRDKEEVIYQNQIQITSHPLAGDGPNGELSAADGLFVKGVISELYQRSLRMTINDIAGNYKAHNVGQKSYKYHQGDRLKVERGVMLAHDNDMMIIRNLRGWLLAFPDEESAAERDATNSGI